MAADVGAAAARICGMDRLTRRHWMLRYYNQGLDGLHSRKAPGGGSVSSPCLVHAGLETQKS